MESRRPDSGAELLLYHTRRFARVTSGENFAILSSSFRLNGLEFNFSIQQFLKSPNDINIDIAKKVSARRKEKQITQEQLSVKSDVSYGSIKRFERTGEISLSSLIKIAFALGMENDFELLFSKKGYSSIQEVINEQ